MAGVKFIMRSINDEDMVFFVGHYDYVSQLYSEKRHVLAHIFPNALRMRRVLYTQGFISHLDDEFDLEYRIELIEK